MVSLKIKPSKKPATPKTAPNNLPATDFSKPWAIWLDDERPVPSKLGFQFVLASNPFQFKALIEEHGIPAFISFDWYLGVGWDNGESVIKWLIETDQQGKHTFPADFMFDVHSSDRTKNRAMYVLLRSYLESKGNMEFYKPR